jgi:exodeoxyribonuclease VII small subunit
MSKKKKNDDRFEDVLAALESEVKRLEQGELSLDETLEAFEKGLALAASARRRLEEAEAKVEELLAVRDGEAKTRPLD